MFSGVQQSLCWRIMYQNEDKDSNRIPRELITKPYFTTGALTTLRLRARAQIQLNLPSRPSSHFDLDHSTAAY